MDKFITLIDVVEESDKKVFEIGKTIMLKKEIDGKQDREKISAYMPIVGRVGEVGNLRENIVDGTFSASRVYDSVSDVFYGKVMFILGDKIILRLIIDEQEKEIKLFDIKKMQKNKKELKLFGQ